jgi:hypothetical protein
MVNISELKHAADIREVYSALGGGKLRGNRGQAFWRGGDGYSIALDPAKNCWFDHRDGIGGDVIAVVEAVRQCGFKEAIDWLAEFTGIPIARDNVTSFPCEPDTDWQTDLQWAGWWKIAAEMLAEQTLEELPSTSPQRHGPTTLLRTIKLGDGALVGEYVEWRRRFPELTAAMARAGQRSDARLQARLARWIRRYADAPEA